MKKFSNNFKKIINVIYKIKFKNIIFIGGITLTFFAIFEALVKIVPNLINVHLNLNLDINFLSIYDIIIGLILPLAIMLIEKINKNTNYITSETYLKETMMFPIIIYFCTNLIIFTFCDEQYYFIITNILSIFFVIYMYFKGFKLLSDLRYEQERIANTRYELVNNDLDNQMKSSSSINNIDKYLKYGIVVQKVNYVDTHGYKKFTIYPSHHLRLITDYNYKLLDRLIKKIEIYNKDSLMSNATSNKTLNVTLNNKLNIIVNLLNIGETIRKDQSCVIIYYNNKYKNEANEIRNFLSEKIYITSEINNHFYIKNNYEYLLDECIKAINSTSAILLEKSLNKYLDIYKDYVNGIKEKIGNYTYKLAYGHTHAFYLPKIYELLELIKKDIIDYSSVILKQDNPCLMNELINFLYKMILHSYTKQELLSINYLYNMYEILMTQVLKFTDTTSYHKIKMDLFEFNNIVENNLNLDNRDFNKDVLLVCNKTIGNILYILSKEQNIYFFEILKKDMKFINAVDEKLEQIKYSKNKNNVIMTKIYEEILSNYQCNLFAILSYVIKDWESQNKNITNILEYYKSYDEDELTNILLDTIDKDYNDRTYSWDLLDKQIFDDDFVGWSSTITYLIHFYCLLLDKNKIKKLPFNYSLSTHSDTIKQELEKLNNQTLIESIDDLEKNIKEEERKYIRSNPISLKRVKNFEKKFRENYYKDNILDKIFKSTNNFVTETSNIEGKNYLGINNITDKLYFLEEMPNGKNIVWDNFENNFSIAFINAEEEKYSTLLEGKTALSKMDVMSYLDKNEIEYNKYIIFANYLTAYSILHSPNIITEIPNDIKYYGLESTRYFKYKNHLIPIYSIDGLNDNYIYLLNINELGKLVRSGVDFKIEIRDFLNNDNLINKLMKSKVEGLDLQGEERKNHLLESVNIFIEEYIKFDDKNIKGIKFNR